MQSCAHNGFGCPYCRTAMATTPEEEDSEYESDDESEAEEERFSDDVLRGFRFFFNNVNNEEHDHEDILEQQEDEEEGEEDEPRPKPSAAHITERLAAQGVTMEQLVKILLMDHDEYDDEDLEHDRIADEVWGQMRIIITNYQEPLVQQQVQQQVLPEPQPQPQEPPTQVAEPKAIVSRRREFMMHV
jgi:hypothetical protein